MSVIGGAVGAFLVILFMILYYRIPGTMASLALIFYGALLLAIFKLWPITLSLAGIGGFVLSMGMAVDANVLIFERMKEELRNGRSLKAAVEAGFDRAWLAIRDSNITTFISCIVLYWVGGLVPNGAPLKGFAVTLFVGAAVSMFTAIVVTRSLLRLIIDTKLSKNISLFIAFTGRK
jgi:preprotein translocase subunit SecD